MSRVNGMSHSLIKALQSRAGVAGKRVTVTKAGKGVTARKAVKKSLFPTEKIRAGTLMYVPIVQHNGKTPFNTYSIVCITEIQKDEKIRFTLLYSPDPDESVQSKIGTVLPSPYKVVMCLLQPTTQSPHLNGRQYIRLIPSKNGVYPLQTIASNDHLTIQDLTTHKLLEPSSISLEEALARHKNHPNVLVPESALKAKQVELTNYRRHPLVHMLQKNAHMDIPNIMREFAGLIGTSKRLPLPFGTCYDPKTNSLVFPNGHVRVHTGIFAPAFERSLRFFQHGFKIGPNQHVWVPLEGTPFQFDKDMVDLSKISVFEPDYKHVDFVDFMSAMNQVKSNVHTFRQAAGESCSETETDDEEENPFSKRQRTMETHGGSLLCPPSTTSSVGESDGEEYEMTFERHSSEEEEEEEEEN